MLYARTYQQWRSFYCYCVSLCNLMLCTQVAGHLFFQNPGKFKNHRCVLERRTISILMCSLKEGANHLKVDFKRYTVGSLFNTRVCFSMSEGCKEDLHLKRNGQYSLFQPNTLKQLSQVIVLAFASPILATFS